MGIIATAGGDQAATNATGALVNVVHALRGIVASKMVMIPKSWQHSENGEITDETYVHRLEKLGKLAVEIASRVGKSKVTKEQIPRIAGAA